ncbi:hypothetical protein RvY_06211-2 [Ramazzottius varieornatus]|uniref:Pre-SET domain-containing protein n=1 Tax=Ramazzottius varieornatus TaxID=947166 RepID=A0A1D1V7G1_RAMVA|nr:hypothetical protein RvY_06211-2 [Ramazzottius varieornatus]
MDRDSGMHRGSNPYNPGRYQPVPRYNHPDHPRQHGPSLNNFARPWCSPSPVPFVNQKTGGFNHNDRGNRFHPYQTDRPFQRAAFHPSNPLEDAQRRTWSEQQTAVGLKRLNDDSDFVWGSTKILARSPMEDESPLQRQLRIFRENQQLELSYTTAASPDNNRPRRHFNRLTDSNQTENFVEALPFLQPGQLGPPVQKFNNDLPAQRMAIEVGRSVRSDLQKEPYQPTFEAPSLFEKAVVSGPHEVEPVYADRNKGSKNGVEKAEVAQAPMEVVESVTDGIELAEAYSAMEEVISKISAISLSRVSTISGRELVLPREATSKVLMKLISSMSTQPLRRLFTSSRIAYSSEDNRKVLNYLALHQHEWEQLKYAEFRPLKASEAPWSFVRSLCGLQLAKFFIMSPTSETETDRLMEIDRLRQRMVKEGRRLMKQRSLETPSTLAQADTLPYGRRHCGAKACEGKADLLVGYCASRVFNMKKAGLDPNEEQLRFCENHVGAVLVHDMCPNCRITSGPRKRMAGEKPGKGVYCLGAEGSAPHENLRHFNHADCMNKVNGKTEWACLHCGNEDVRRFVGRQLQVDWTKKRVCSDEKDMMEVLEKRRQGVPAFSEKPARPIVHSVATLWRPGPKIETARLPPQFLPKDKKPSASKSGAETATKKFMERRGRKDIAEAIRTSTVLLQPPLFNTCTSHFKSHTITDGIAAAGQRQSGRKILTSEKYAMALVSISGKCEGCLCEEVCVPAQCPCMSWYSATKGYNEDQSLQMEGFDFQHDFVRECSETCSCNIKQCANRASQAPPRVQLRDGRKLVLTRDVHQGDFLFRMAGELNDTKTEWPEERTFLLPKLPIWPPGCEKYSLCMKDFQGPARLIRSVRQCQEEKRPADVNAVPVMVLQPPLGIHIGHPRQVAIPVVAFFAMRTIRAGEVDLVYESDFRAVNPVVPTLKDVATEDGTDGEPIEVTGTLFNPFD